MSLKHWWNWWAWYSLLSCCFQDLIMRFDNTFDLYLHLTQRSAKVSGRWNRDQHDTPSSLFKLWGTLQSVLPPAERSKPGNVLSNLLWDVPALGPLEPVFALREKQQIFSCNRIKQIEKHQARLAPYFCCNQKLYWCSIKVTSGRKDNTASWLFKTERADMTTWIKTTVKIRKISHYLLHNEWFYSLSLNQQLLFSWFIALLKNCSCSKDTFKINPKKE